MLSPKTIVSMLPESGLVRCTCCGAQMEEKDASSERATLREFWCAPCRRTRMISSLKDLERRDTAFGAGQRLLPWV